MATDIGPCIECDIEGTLIVGVKEKRMEEKGKKGSDSRRLLNKMDRIGSDRSADGRNDGQRLGNLGMCSFCTI